MEFTPVGVFKRTNKGMCIVRKEETPTQKKARRSARRRYIAQTVSLECTRRIYRAAWRRVKILAGLTVFEIQASQPEDIPSLSGSKRGNPDGSWGYGRNSTNPGEQQ